MKRPKKITWKHLSNAKMCDSQVDRFREKFPKGLEVLRITDAQIEDLIATFGRGSIFYAIDGLLETYMGTKVAAATAVRLNALMREYLDTNMTYDQSCINGIKIFQEVWAQ